MISYVKLVHILLEPDWLIQNACDVHLENIVVLTAWILLVRIVMLDTNVKVEI